MYKVIGNLFVSLVHFFLAYIYFILALIINDIPILFILLIIIIIIKLFYIYFGRCILTIYEYNDHFSPLVELFSKTLTTTHLKHCVVEEILINIGLLITLNKLAVLMFYNYYF